MTSYVTSKDVLNNTNIPIQIGEISSTTSNLTDCKRKNPSSVSLPHKMIKTGHYEESNVDQSEIDHLFQKIFDFCTEVEKDQDKSSKLITLDSLFSEENLNQTLNSLFTKTLLEKTKKEGIRSSLEQDPCCGEYWKELHAKSHETLSLKDLQKLHFCLEASSLDQRIQELLIPIKLNKAF